MFGWFNPFSSATMNRVQRLQRLKALADTTTGDQGEWRSCLWSEARRDQKLLAAGMPPNGTVLFDSEDKDRVYRFFGVDARQGRQLFGANHIEFKREEIKRLIELAEQEGFFDRLRRWAA